MAISFAKKTGATLRIQIQGKDGGKAGTTGENDRWCYTITDAAGPVFAPFNKFNTKCWDNTGTYYTTPGLTRSCSWCRARSARPPTTSASAASPTGADKSAAPPCPACTADLPGHDRRLGRDRPRLPARQGRRGGGKSYIIQNNNWGNPSGTNQTISYKNNSFNITSATGAGAGRRRTGVVPVDLHRRQRRHRRWGTSPPRPMTTCPRWSARIRLDPDEVQLQRNSGNYNATYDVWFSANKPAGRYNDGISGFVMVWLYKPGNNQPIGSKMRTATIAGQNWDVWVGPRGGSGSNSGAPVVSYVAQSSLTVALLQPQGLHHQRLDERHQFGLVPDRRVRRLRDLGRQRHQRPRRHRVHRERAVAGRHAQPA